LFLKGATLPSKRPKDLCHQIGLFRYAVVSELVSRPPEKGELASKLRELAEKKFRVPGSQEEGSISIRTLERWLSIARTAQRANEALQPKQRSDRGVTRAVPDAHKEFLMKYREKYPRWGVQLLYDNLCAAPLEGKYPSYSTVLRFLKSHGFLTNRSARRKIAREVRTFEVEFVGELWHMDFHHGSRMVIDENGEFQRAICMAIIDDKSRLACHVQWFLQETAEVLVHGFIQAVQKRGLPRDFYTDNGSAMRAEEFVSGLASLDVTPKRTLPYSAYMNGKQECFWKPLEERFMRMIPSNKRITLDILNSLTQAWVEQDYHVTRHRETGEPPLERFLNSKDVLRPAPELGELRRCFRQRCTRRQRLTDNTVTIDGVRFEVPTIYGHIEELTLRYARWDLGEAEILCPSTHKSLCTIHPVNRILNAQGLRKQRDGAQAAKTKEESFDEEEILDLKSDQLPPLLARCLERHHRMYSIPTYLPPIQRGEKSE
jgi:putative transposase